jgi:hypothetical protein
VREKYDSVSKSSRIQSIAKYTLTFGITHWEATQRVMAAKLTRLTHKIAIQLHLVTKSSTICSSRSRRPVRNILDTPSYVLWNMTQLKSPHSITNQSSHSTSGRNVILNTFLLVTRKLCFQDARFEVFKAMKMQSLNFWVLMACSDVVWHGYTASQYRRPRLESSCPMEKLISIRDLQQKSHLCHTHKVRR